MRLACGRLFEMGMRLAARWQSQRRAKGEAAVASSGKAQESIHERRCCPVKNRLRALSCAEGSPRPRIIAEVKKHPPSGRNDGETVRSSRARANQEPPRHPTSASKHGQTLKHQTQSALRKPSDRKPGHVQPEGIGWLVPRSHAPFHVGFPIVPGPES